MLIHRMELKLTLFHKSTQNLALVAWSLLGNYVKARETFQNKFKKDQELKISHLSQSL